MLRKKNQGFTLIECMVGLFISVFIINSTTSVFYSGTRVWDTGSVKVELHQNLRKVMDWVTEEIRQAGMVTVSSVPADGVWYNTITFQKAGGVSNGKIVWGSENIQYILGGLYGKQFLRRVVNMGQERVLANDITLFWVRRMPASPEIIEFSLKAQKNTKENRLIEADLNFQVKMRN